MPALVLIACQSVVVDDDNPGADDDTAVTDTGLDDTGSDDTGSDDTGSDDTGQNPDDAPVSGVSARIHEEFGTLVYVAWEQEQAASAYVEYRFDDESWLHTPAVDAEVGHQEHLLLGIPYGVEVQFRVVNELGGSDGILASAEVGLTIDDAPRGVPSAIAVSGTDSAWDPDLNYVLTSMDDSMGGGYWSFIVDRQGRVVWARRTAPRTITLHPRVSYGGDTLLIDQSSFWEIFDGGATSQVVRMKIDGSDEVVYDTPGLYHAFTDLPDGSIVWNAYQDDDDTVEQLKPDGEQERIWSCKEGLPTLHPSDYCAANTLTWDDDRDVFLYSSYSLETLVEIDHASGETLRFFGHIRDAWGFDDSEHAFWWQHGGYFTDAGTLITSSDLSPRGEETVVREYELDEANETLVEIWSFGEGEGIYGEEMGEAHRLAGGNTLHNYGNATRLREITHDGEVVWDIEWHGSFMGRSVPIADLYALAP